MNRDLVGGALLFIIAMGVFRLHYATNRKRPDAPPVPEYVRVGIFLCGAVLLRRAVDLFQISDTDLGPGHLDAWSMMATFSIVYLVAGLLLWENGFSLPKISWQRLGHALSATKADPDHTAVVVMTGHEVAEDLRARGFSTVEAGEGPDAVWREGKPRPKPHD